MDCNDFFVYKCGLVFSPSLLFTPHHHKSRQKGAAFGSGSFIQENIERKLKTFVKVSQIPHSKFQWFYYFNLFKSGDLIFDSMSQNMKV